MLNLFNLIHARQANVRPVVLLILDGFGIAPPSEGNAIAAARKPIWDYLKANFAVGELIAAGESVGLPANEAGNSEVGHLTLGAGRVILQSLLRIDEAIVDESFYQNQALLGAVKHARQQNSWLHIMGLISSGTVHASNEHLYALMELARRERFDRVKYHLFMDGRDAPPRDGIKVLEQIQAKIAHLGVGVIATVSGRYFSMDRDGRWARTKKVYEAIVAGVGARATSPIEAVKTAYSRKLTDEFVEPTIIASPNVSPGMDDNDAVIFFNFRVDRPRQLTLAFTHPDFEHFRGFEVKRGRRERSNPTFTRIRTITNLYFVTMTQYQENIPVSAVAFPPTQVDEPLSQVVSAAGLAQVHIAETEKERMVGFYFNGLREQRFAGEEMIIVASPRVATYMEKPEMSVFQLVNKFKKIVREDKYHLIVMNFANPDMVAHSGNVQATVAAIEAVDRALGQVYGEVRARSGVLVITADHGNAEDLLSYPAASFFFTSEAGEVNTEHSNNPVPIVIADARQASMVRLPQGSLSDVAPTLLSVMKLPVPAGMTGKNLLDPRLWIQV